MSENLVLIIATDIQSSIDSAGESIEDKAMAAFIAVKNHWITGDEVIRFSGAVTGLVTWLKNHDRIEDADRVEWEMKFLNSILSGSIPYNNERILDNPIGLIPMYKKVIQSNEDME